MLIKHFLYADWHASSVSTAVKRYTCHRPVMTNPHAHYCLLRYCVSTMGMAFPNSSPQRILQHARHVSTAKCAALAHKQLIDMQGHNRRLAQPEGTVMVLHLKEVN